MTIGTTNGDVLAPVSFALYDEIAADSSGARSESVPMALLSAVPPSTSCMLSRFRRDFVRQPVGSVWLETRPGGLTTGNRADSSAAVDQSRSAMHFGPM